MRAGDRAASLLVRAYGALLWLFPARFRAAYAADMRRVLRLRLTRARRASGWRGLFAGFASAVADVLLAAAGERVRAARNPPKPIQPPAPRRKADPMMYRLLDNVRFSARSLARQPTLTLTVLSTLAVGTAATIAIFSVVDGALVQPLPYPDADRIVSVVQASDTELRAFSPPFLDDFRAHTTAFDALAGFSASGWIMTMAGTGEPRVVAAAYVSGGFLDLLGVRPLAGRFFDDAEHAADGARVAIFSARLWASTFGEEATMDRPSVTLSGVPHVVVGVLPPDFRMPITGSSVSTNRESADLLLPFEGHWSASQRGVPIMNVVGRRAADVSVERADAEVAALHGSFAAEFPNAALLPRFRALDLSEQVTRSSRGAVLLLFGAAGLLLLIACVNVANLMLARAAGRRQELAVRASLGAGRWRLAEQIVTEALMLALVGCAAGLGLATWILSVAPGLGLQNLPPTAEVSIDGRVVLFAGVLVFLCAGLFGLIPSLYGCRAAVYGALRVAQPGGGRGAQRARNALVVAEVALALVLLVGAGLLASSFWRLTRVDPGFRAAGILAVPLSIADAGYQTADARGVFMHELVEALSGVAGVERVAAVNRLPLAGANVLVGIQAEGRPDPDGLGVLSDRRVVTPGYFAAMEIPIEEGRPFSRADDRQSEFGAAIVNRAAAERYWPEGQAVGRRLRLMLRGGPGDWLTVVGVVGDVRHHGLDQRANPEVYVPYQQASVETMVVVLRSSDPAALVAAVRTRIRDLDADLPLDRIEALVDVVDASIGEPRLRTLILNTFAAVATVLAAIGLFGVVAYSVVQRTRDIAVRAALGAESRQILWMTVREGLLLGVVGVVFGLGGAVGTSRFLEGLLFDVEPTDVPTYAAVSLLLLAVVAGASYLPARSATRVDPVAVLRGD